MGFETDPWLSETKERLTSHCLPCMTGLYEALKEKPETIALTHAWNCWKVTVVARDADEALFMLQAFGERYPEEPVRGKFGGNVGRPTAALIFHTDSEAKRDRVRDLLARLIDEAFPGRTVFISRACGNPYETLLGPWKDWTRTCRIAHPERIEAVRTALRDSLYRNS